MEMESMLYEAAFEGRVPTLLELLQQDRLILDRVAMNSRSETPLHVAALLGHVDFVKEILRRKPELAEELDPRKSSALHIASHKGYVDMVKALLQANPDMCFARDVDGRNPLHLAAMKGRIAVLGELLGTRPAAASSTTILGETILHFCVQYSQLEALKFLLEKMDHPREILNANDAYGMTILHLAVAEKQIEVIKFLTSRTEINVNALNAHGLTALDVLAQSKRDVKYWEIGESLRLAGAISVKDIIHLSTDEHGTTQTNKCLISHDNNQKQQGKGLKSFLKKEDDWLEKMRNALMVVASLIATMAFQAGVNPPNLPWQDPSSPDKASLATAESSRHNLSSFGLKSVTGRFYLYNTIGFLASLSVILLLISGLPLNRRIFMWILTIIMWVAITAMAFTYRAAKHIITHPENLYSSAPSVIIFIWMSVWGILLLGHGTRLIIKMIKQIKKSVRRTSYIHAEDCHQPPIASVV